MENATLLQLLEADREMVLGGIARDRAPQAVQTALEKAIDRVMYRYVEQCPDAGQRDAARLMLQTMKQALPLVDSVGEVRRWQKSAGGGAPEKRKLSPVALAALIAGCVLVAAVVLGLAFTGGGIGALAFVRALVPAAAGMAAVFWAGMRFAKPRKAKRREDVPDVRDEFLVDADRVWHYLKGMMLMADSALDNVRAQAAAEEQRAAAGAEAPRLPREQAELFAGLLENAYAQAGADAKEMIEGIRFFLHGTGVDVVDFAAGREGWFEFLPAQRPGTIRPALVSEGKLIKKGLASA